MKAAWRAFPTIAAVVILSVLAVRLVQQPWGEVTEFSKVAIWPVVVVFVLLVLRKPISSFFENVATRVSKISAFDIAVELSAPDTAKPLEMPTVEKVRQPSMAFANDSSASLFEHVGQVGTVDYALIDLGEGQEWLTSRVYILACLLPRMRGVRQIAFVASRRGRNRAFLGCASPDQVRWRFAMQFPWLEQEYVSALERAVGIANYDDNQPLIASTTGGLEPHVATRIVSNFIYGLQRDEVNVPPHQRTRIHSRPDTYERAEWLDAEKLARILGDSLNQSTVDDNAGKSEHDLVRQVLRQRGDFVGRVNQLDEFVSLVDRHVVLEEAAQILARKAG